MLRACFKVSMRRLLTKTKAIGDLLEGSLSFWEALWAWNFRKEVFRGQLPSALSAFTRSRVTSIGTGEGAIEVLTRLSLDHGWECCDLD